MLGDSFDRRDSKNENGRVEAMKWQATDQIRIASMEKTYMERVREMTKREMELPQSEFSRAQHMWERAREEVERERKKGRRVGLIRLNEGVAVSVSDIEKNGLISAEELHNVLRSLGEECSAIAEK
ncbi:hypothetical protein L1887_36684 [Cichorium endivia]|nr:hypothetical protein L1887_36684 [Cichorium endivia]